MPCQKITARFNTASTAAEVVRGIDLTDHTAVVTGAASGIGIEIVRALASAGAELAVHDTTAGQRVATDIITATGSTAARVEELDLAELSPPKTAHRHHPRIRDGENRRRSVQRSPRPLDGPTGAGPTRSARIRFGRDQLGRLSPIKMLGQTAVSRDPRIARQPRFHLRLAAMELSAGVDAGCCAQ